MLTTLQQKILFAIRRHVARHGQAPTLNEIGEAVGLNSKGTVHRYVQALIDKGYLERHGQGWRGLRLSRDSGPQQYTLPLLGRIAAGHPIEAIPDQEEINLAEFFTGPNRFVLKVQGDSMIDAGILDGDMVVIQHRSSADNGDIVVALIDGEEATLKRLRHRKDGSVELIPANPRLSTMIYAAERVAIQGVVVGQMRSYT